MIGYNRSVGRDEGIHGSLRSPRYRHGNCCDDERYDEHDEFAKAYDEYDEPYDRDRSTLINLVLHNLILSARKHGYHTAILRDYWRRKTCPHPLPLGHIALRDHEWWYVPLCEECGLPGRATPQPAGTFCAEASGQALPRGWKWLVEDDGELCALCPRCRRGTTATAGSNRHHPEWAYIW